MGVFFPGEGGEVFTEPEETTSGTLANGFLTDAAFGPVPLQLLLSSNYSGKSASALINGLVIEPMNEVIAAQNPAGTAIETIDADEHFFRIGSG